MLLRTLLVAGSLLTACGGDDGGSAEPLIASSLTASYAGAAFTPKNGFATLYMGKYVVVVGDGNIHCGSESASEPPPGRTAVFAIDSLDVGVHSSFTQMFTNVGDYEGIGSSTGGSVSIETSTATSIAGSASYAYTDDANRMFSVAGTFEAIVCP